MTKMNVSPGLTISIHVTSDTDGFATREYAAEKAEEARKAALPADPQPHQHLVTGADGKAVWEEKLAYTEERTSVETLFSGEYTTGSVVFPPITTFENPGFSMQLGNEYNCALIYDGEVRVEFSGIAEKLFDGLSHQGIGIQAEIDGNDYTCWVQEESGALAIGGLYLTNTTYTINVSGEVTGTTIKPIDRKYLPALTPVIGVLTGNERDFYILDPELGASHSEIRRAMLEGRPVGLYRNYNDAAMFWCTGLVETFDMNGDGSQFYVKRFISPVIPFVWTSTGVVSYQLDTIGVVYMAYDSEGNKIDIPDDQGLIMSGNRMQMLATEDYVQEQIAAAKATMLVLAPDDGDCWTADNWAEYFAAYQAGTRIFLESSDGNMPVIGFSVDYGVYSLYVFNSYVGAIDLFRWDDANEPSTVTHTTHGLTFE